MLEHSYNVFATVAEYCNFSKAADQLNLTASAVSHTVAKLEAEFGFPLFVRQRSGVSLTPNGERVLAHIKELRRSHVLLDKEISSIQNKTSGVLRIAATQSTTIRWLSKILPGFIQEHPDINISIRQGIHKHIVAWLENYDVDVAVCAYNEYDNFNFTPLYNDPIICLFPDGFVPENPGYVQTSELAGKRIIIHQECAELEIPKFLADNNIEKDPSFNIDDDLSILSIVKCGLGVALMPQLAYQALNAEANVFPIIPGTHRILGLSVPDKRFVDPVTETFCQEVIQFVATNQLR